MGCQPIDAFNNALQVVLGCAAEKPNLHIHDDDCVHDLLPPLLFPTLAPKCAVRLHHLAVVLAAEPDG